MLFRVNTSLNKFYVFGLALLFTVALAGCGGGGTKKKAMDTDTGPDTGDTCPAGQIGTPPDCADPARPEANAKSVMAKAMGIMGAEGSTAAPFDTTDANTNYVVAVDPSDGTVTVTDPMGTSDDMDDEELTAGDAPHAIDGDVWAGSTFTRDMEKVIVYTDVKDPTPTDFGEEGTDVSLDANPNDATPPVNQSVAVDADNLAKIKTDGITSVGAGQITVLAAVEDDEGTMDMDETVAAFETDATFDGADGRLKCAGAADCTVTLDADGEIESFGPGWQFTPDDGETIDVDDDDYLHYGFWVESGENDDGDPTYSIQTFSGGSMAYTGSLSALEGSATYNGSAAGVYAQKTTYDPGTGELTGGHVGAFTADVTLEANFGTPTSVAVDDQNAISGTISNLTDGEFALPEDWVIDLETKKFTADSGETTGDGSWTANFFGPATDADGGIQPSGVAGEFVVHFGNGHAAGAYGADIKK